MTNFPAYNHGPRSLRERRLVSDIACDDNQPAALILARPLPRIASDENRSAPLTAQAARITPSQIVAGRTSNRDRPTALLRSEIMPRVAVNC